MSTVRPPVRTTTTFSAHSSTSGGRNMSSSQAARTAGSALCANIACPSNKFYGINCRPKLGTKLLDRFFHRRRQVSPPVNRLTHCFFDGCYHLIDGDVAVGLCHSLAPLFRSATAETTSLAGSAAGSGRHSKTRCPNFRYGHQRRISPFRNGSHSRRTAAVKSAADRLDYLSGITISRSLVLTTKTA